MNRRKFLQTVAVAGVASGLPEVGTAKGLEYLQEIPPVGNELECGSHPEVSRIALIGVGGAGERLVRSLAPVSREYSCTAVDTDAFALAGSVASTCLQIGEPENRPTTPEIARALARAQAGDISKLISGAEAVIVVAGLGGACGTGVAPVVAEIARESGALTLGFVVLPFSWEGKRRNQVAATGLRVIERRSHQVVAYRNTPGTQQVTLSDALKNAMPEFRRFCDRVAEGSVGAQFDVPVRSAL